MNAKLIAPIDNKISEKTIDFLKDIITGDAGKTEYLSGPKLVDFFNEFGFKDKYERGFFPSRWLYVQKNLRELNEQNQIKEFLEYYFNPINFIENKKLLNDVIKEVNEYLSFDDLSIVIIDKKCIVASTNNTNITLQGLQKIDSDFIKEHLEKCDRKIIENDYSGAITNARSLVEAIFLYIKAEITEKEEKFDGDLLKLYKNISGELNLSTNKNLKIDKSFKKILSGLNSIISGITELGNELGDRHGKTGKKYKVEKHHSLLVVNSAKTISEFIFESFEKQFLTKK